MAVTIPAWLAWMLSAFVLNESYGPPCFGFGLIGVCMITFVIMFVPKSRQLSAIGELIFKRNKDLMDHPVFVFLVFLIWVLLFSYLYPKSHTFLG